jgi:hypothetical protein
MILFLSVIVLALVAGLAAGGSFRRLEDVRLRWWLLAPLGFALRELPLAGGRDGGDLVIRMIVFGVSYVLVLVFATRNWRVPAMPLVILGLLLNGLVVTANGGMPVSRSALVASGERQLSHALAEDRTRRHYLLRPGEDVLTPLADIIPVPSPIEDVVSVGDVLLYAGLVWMIIATMGGQTRGFVAEQPSGGRHRRGAAAKLPVGSLAGTAPAAWATGAWSFPAAESRGRAFRLRRTSRSAHRRHSE